VLILGTLFVEWRAGLLAPKTAALAYLLAGVPVTAWNLVWVWRRFRLRVAMHVEQLKNLLSYGVRAWGADLIGTVANQVDRLMVVGLLAPQLMGLYVVAQSAANLLNVLPAAMVPVLLPKAVDRSTEEIVQLTGRAARVTLLVLLAAGLPLILLGGFLLHLFYGAKFAGSTGVLRLLVIESVLDGVTYVLSQAFLAAGIPGTVALLQGVGLVSAIPLLAFFVPRWGLMGAGLAVLIATAARLAFVLGNFVVRLKSRPPSLLLSPSDFVTLMRRG
jgi:O-antigen/teichoic acid export membrane protein